MRQVWMMVMGLVVTAGWLFAAGELDQARLSGRTDKAIPLYAPGEEMVFTLRLRGVEALPADTYFVTWERTGDDGKKESGKVPASLTEPIVIKTALEKPGFVRILAHVVDQAGKRYEREGVKGDGRWVFFDGGAGVEIDKLQGVPEPADFDAFWAKQKARLAEVPLKATRTEMPGKNPNVKIYAVSIDCAGPRPVTGYLTIPSVAKPLPARLETHGYGTNVQHAPQWGPMDCIVLNINAHGYELGKDKAYYDAFFKSIVSNGQGYAFDPKQNADPETAYFNGMALRVMRGLQYLESLPEWNGKDLWASGGSQGGLQTIWAASLDPKVTRADSSVTWCCDMGGTELGRNRGGWYVHWVPALGYYDPINLCRRIPKSCRVTIPRAGLGDYTCPPSGLAILFNNMTCPKKIVWIQGSTHGYVPPADQQVLTVETCEE
ncbi:MAG: acetylxylan esterase [Kiritimatiellae bacterium]|nr:acetylxylan esterase [Kiritimatiellia bacterium]